MIPNRSLNRSKDPIFVNPDGSPIGGKAISNLFYYNSNKLLKNGELKHRITAHMMRHGTAQSIMASDLGRDLMDNLVLVRNTFGHNQIKTTEVYAYHPLQMIRNISTSAPIVSRYDEAEFIVNETQLKFNI